MKTLPMLSVLTRPLTTATQIAVGPKAVSTTGDSLTFSPGQTLRAVVVAENAANQFTLETGGSRFAVQSRVPLSPGQTLDLKVLSTDPKIELQITEDTVGRLFGRSLAATGGSQDLQSLSTLLQQVPSSQLQNLSGASLETLQQFARLQQQITPGQEGATTGQVLSPSDYGPKVLDQIFAQLGAQVENLFSEGKAQAALTLVKSALQDIAQLFQGKEQLPQAALSQLDNLAPSDKQLFETLSLLQQNSNAGQGTKEAAFSQLLQQLQWSPENPPNGASLTNSLNSLQSGLVNLVIFMKGPEGLLQLFSADTLQSGLLTQAQLEDSLALHSGAVGPEAKGGEQLQQLVAKLGLNLESMLAAGNKEEAVKTVKFGLMELVQNFAEQSKLVESGKQALNTVEFFQLAQLQAAQRDALILPLPLPFLQQGYLVVENYQDQSGKGGGTREMPEHFSLFLKLTPLGNLKIDFLSTGQGVYIRFHSESKEVSAFLTQFQDELNTAITGTLVHGISFTEHAEDPLAALAKSSRTGGSALIDTKI